MPHDAEIPETTEVLEKTLTALTEGLAGIFGIASSERKQWLLSLGHILQCFRGRKFLDGFIQEWKYYRDKGRIADDYLDTEQHRECMQDLLDYLDQDGTDQKRFSILKNIVLSAATEERSTRESVLPQQFMKIVRGLTSGEAIVLFSAYSIAKRGEPIDSKSGIGKAHHWLCKVAQESGLKYAELVESHEKGLIDKKLLKERALGNVYEVQLGSSFRLTSLGYELCDFVKDMEVE